MTSSKKSKAVKVKPAASTKRPDGRKPNEIRKIECEVGVIKNAEGSARFKIGETIAYAAVYGPRDVYPKFLQDPRKALLRCKYDLMSFSVSERKKPQPSRRDTELSLVIANSLAPTVFLERYPKMGVDIFVEIPQADAGTRCAGMCAASLALADAGIEMRELAGAISVGALGESVVTDLTKEEEDWEEGATDMPVTYLPKNKLVTNIQLDGEISLENWKKALRLGIEKCIEIVKIEEEALKTKYARVGGDDNEGIHQ